MSSRTTKAVQQEAVSAGDLASPAEKVEIVGSGERRGSDESPDAAQADSTTGTDDTAEADGSDADGSDADGPDADGPDADGPEGATEVRELAASETPVEGAGAKLAGETKTPEALETAESAEPVEASEPTELIEMSEPVELAEAVELTEPAPRGHGLLLAGAFVMAAVLIIGAAVGIVGALTHGFRKPAPIVTYKTSPVFTLRTGECVNTNGQRFSVVSCAVPHDAEVYATFRLPNSAWPGTPKVRTLASAGCQSRLSGYLNPQLALALGSTYVFPGEVAWQAGTRTVVCEVRAISGQLTGSVRAGAGAAA